jgi:hypothetical protein
VVGKGISIIRLRIESQIGVHCEELRRAPEPAGRNQNPAALTKSIVSCFRGEALAQQTVDIALSQPGRRVSRSGDRSAGISHIQSDRGNQAHRPDPDPN